MRCVAEPSRRNCRNHPLARRSRTSPANSTSRVEKDELREIPMFARAASAATRGDPNCGK
eukprot:scaffold237152_cov30-Tisochrysis_lutea.AAC.7